MTFRLLRSLLRCPGGMTRRLLSHKYRELCPFHTEIESLKEESHTPLIIVSLTPFIDKENKRIIYVYSSVTHKKYN